MPAPSSNRSTSVLLAASVALLLGFPAAGCQSGAGGLGGGLSGGPSAPGSGGGATGMGEDAGISCTQDPEQEGCPCAEDGESIACYPGWAQGDDGSLTCEIGARSCDAGRWSACGDIQTVVYESVGALISPIDTCNPCNPTCFRAVDTPTCDPAPGAACDLCTPARRAALIAAGLPGCIVNTDTTIYSPTRGGITPAATAPVPAVLPDTDRDGIPDVADSCVGPGAFAAADGSCYGDLFFYHMLPYGGPSAIDPAPITTQIRTADVYVLMDTTGSMGGELSTLRTTLTSGSYLTGCSNGILGAIRCTIPDAWFGVGFHDDIPYAPYGQSGCYGGDLVLGHRTNITSALATAQTGVTGLALHCGYDGPESNLQAMWAVATGGSIGGWLAARTGCPAGTWGYPCWRSGTIPILINITDAPYHNGPPDPAGTYPYYSPVVAPTWTQTVTALNDRDIRVITAQSCGYWSDGYCLQGERVARALGNATGSLGSAGTPYVFRVASNGTGLSATLVNAVRDLANYSRMDVSARASGDLWGFTRSIAAVSWGPRGSCTGISGGTVFTQCLPGTDVRFNVEFRNTTVMSTMVAQVFTFYIEIVGDGTVVLSRIPVRIVVPPVVAAYEPMGTYFRDYDSTVRCDQLTSCAAWGTFRWTADVPAGTSIRFEFRSTNSAAGLPTATPVATYNVTTSGSGSLNISLLLESAGARSLLPYLRVSAVLLSSADRTRAPALSSMETAFTCVACM